MHANSGLETFRCVGQLISRPHSVLSVQTTRNRDFNALLGEGGFRPNSEKNVSLVKGRERKRKFCPFQCVLWIVCKRISGVCRSQLGHNARTHTQRDSHKQTNVLQPPSNPPPNILSGSRGWWSQKSGVENLATRHRDSTPIRV